MVRFIWLVLLSVFLVVALYFGYQNLIPKSKKTTSLYQKIPGDAFLIVDIERPYEQWKNISNNSIVWEEFKIFPFLNQLDELGSSIHAGNIFTYNGVLPLERIVLTATERDDGAVIPHYILEIGQDIEEQFIIDNLSKLLSATINLDEETKVWKIKTDSTLWYASKVEKWIMVTPELRRAEHFISEELVSEVSSEQFLEVKRTVAEDAEVKLYIKSGKWHTLFQSLLNERTKNTLSENGVWFGWFEGDIDQEPDNISLRGFASAADSLDQKLSMFKGHNPVQPRVLEWLPNRFSMITHVGSDRIGDLITQIRKAAPTGLKGLIVEWDSLYDIRLDHDFTRWIEREVAYVMHEPDRYSSELEYSLWINFSDSKTVFKKLGDISVLISNHYGKELQVLPYRGYEIRKIDEPNFIPAIFGGWYSEIRNNFYLQLKDYLVFSNSPATLQWIVDRYERGEILGRDADFEQYERDLNDESNLLIINSIASSVQWYKSLGSANNSTWIDEHTSWIRNFQAAALQVSYERGNLYYINLHLKYNPVYKEQFNTLWELALDTTADMKPILVRNHYTGAPEIVVQDNLNNLYLISNKGRVLWKRKLDSPIQGEVVQIDSYQNRKLQLAFNTRNRVYIIDRNGIDLPNFPIQLPAMSTTSMTILDYEKNGEYRFLVPCSGGQIFNYNLEGKKVKGWDYISTGARIAHPIIWNPVKNSDHLIVIFDNGEVKTLNRRGNVRLNLASRFTGSIANYAIKGGRNLESTYCYGVDTAGNTMRISLSDKFENLFSINDTILSSSFLDVNRDGTMELMVVLPHKIKVYHLDGKVLTSIDYDGVLASKPHVFSFSGKHWLSYTSQNTQRVYLVDEKAQIHPDFPLLGSGSITISDINNDQKLNVISTDQSGVMMVFTLNQ